MSDALNKFECFIGTIWHPPSPPIPNATAVEDEAAAAAAQPGAKRLELSDSGPEGEDDPGLLARLAESGDSGLRGQVQQRQVAQSFSNSLRGRNPTISEILSLSEVPCLVSPENSLMLLWHCCSQCCQCI